LKHLATVFLLSILILQSGGYYIVFCADMIEAKHEASEYVNDANKNDDRVTVLTFPVRDGKIVASNLIFNDEGEFTYQCKMYDVISTERGKNQITFKCYTDDKETGLNQNLCNKIDSDKNMPSQKHRNNLLIKLLTHSFTINSKLAYCFAVHISTTYRLIYQNSQQSFIYRIIVSPPPETLSV
jgi:hypothetical protein